MFEQWKGDRFGGQVESTFPFLPADLDCGHRGWSRSLHFWEQRSKEAHYRIRKLPSLVTLFTFQVATPPIGVRAINNMF